MRRHWKDLAQGAAKSAFTPEEVCEALPYALKRDILEAPIKDIRDIMGGGSLFPELRVEKLETLRETCRGSASANLTIDCAIEAATNGLTGEAGTEVALRNALEDTARSALRGMEEHYEREANPRSAGHLRTRLDAARQKLDCGALAREILSSEKPSSRRSVTMPRHSGVDEGPQL